MAKSDLFSLTTVSIGVRVTYAYSRRLQSPPIRAFKKFYAIIKIWADAICCIHVSTLLSNQSVSQSLPLSLICSYHMPDFFG